MNGEWIPGAVGARILTNLREATRDWPHAPTFFEIATLLARGYLAEAGTD